MGKLWSAQFLGNKIKLFDGGVTLCHIGVVAFSHSPAHNGPTYDPSSDLSHDNTADTWT